MYVHKEGQFLFKNALTEVSNIDHITDISLDIKVKQFASTPNMECAPVTHSFDSCAERFMSSDLAGDHCELFLIKGRNKSTLCKSKKDYETTLRLFQTSLVNCPEPCNQIEVSLRENPVDWLYILMNPQFPVKTVIPGYYLKLPSKVLASEMYESYTSFSFIAEFGGWVSLFLGISVLGAIKSLLQLHSGSGKVIKKLAKEKLPGVLLVFKMFCAVGLMYILYKCCEKLITGEKQLDVNLVHNPSINISLSLCSMENIYKVPFKGSNHSYIGNHSDFWLKSTNLSKKLQAMTVVFQNGESLLVFHSEKNLKHPNYIFGVINTPKYGTYIESCHFLNLNAWSSIKTIELETNEELSIDFHMAGQLLRHGKQGYNFINKYSVSFRYRLFLILPGSIERFHFQFSYNYEETLELL